MTLPTPRTLLLALAITGAIVTVVIVANYLIIRTNGRPVAVPEIPRSVESFGTGTPLKLMVLGDSTTVSQGSDYDQGYARGVARHLAGKGSQVQLYNVGVSGAQAADVAEQQVAKSADFKPDIAIVGVGANDVTHLTRIATVRQHLQATIKSLRAANPNVRIVLTGSPQMGSVPRFPQPAKALARLRTGQINRMVIDLARESKVTFAPIAARTGPEFDKHPEYFAADKFHPNSTGYALWTPVIADAVASAQQPRE